ncbi:hypothetical protein HBI57_066090 [Parastagonospora nodorum]|nr:hypothetical protein HBI57_066090 [Parastagonospora nodorum]KAH6484199.1 hypothetical protein HBI58_065940 [Parastagonospora nodorum]
MTALPSQTRTHLRNLMLHEDRKVTHHPERDGKRLISFCQENVSLRIERRVSLWGNIWLASSDWHNEDDDFILPTLSVTKRELAPWIMEAVCLPSLGMPQDAFTLVLDGNSRPDPASEIFAVAQQDASWQTAFERSNAWLSSSHEEARRSASYIMDSFPKAIHNIVDGTSLVKCNFRPLPNYGPDGSPNPEIDQSLYTNPQWPLFQYTTHWYFRSVKEFEVRTRKPDWLDMRRIAWE